MGFFVKSMPIIIDGVIFNYSNEFSKMVAEEYLRFFDFTGLTLDKALRWAGLVDY